MNYQTFKYIGVSLLVLSAVGVGSVGWTKSAKESVKNFIDEAADAMKEATDKVSHAVDKMGENLEEAQEYLDHYPWKGIIQDTATSDPVTLKDLKLNGHSRVVVVKPGERIQGEVECHLDPDKCSALALYRVVIGIHGEGAQASIGNELGLAASDSHEKFVLIAPAAAGMYRIHFRVVKDLFKAHALGAWIDKHGNEPDASTAIGIIVVRG